MEPLAEATAEVTRVVALFEPEALDPAEAEAEADADADADAEPVAIDELPAGRGTTPPF